MRSFLLFFIFCFAGTNLLFAQCINTSLWPSGTVAISNSGSITSISTCNYTEEYSNLSGAVLGNEYTFSIVDDFDTDKYITITTTSNVVLAHGPSPLIWTSSLSGNIRAHWTEDGTCLTAEECHTTTVQCTSCTPPPAPANDEPCGAIALTLIESETCSGYPIDGTNLNATSSTGIPAPGCASYSGGDVWYSFVVPTNGTVTVDLQVGDITDSGMAFYSSSDNTCSGSFTLIECDDDDSPNGAMSLITRSGLTPGNTIFVRVWEYGNNLFGTFSVCGRTPPPPVGCPIPTAVLSNTVTSNSANITWACSGCLGTYVVEYGPPGFTPGTGATAGVSGIVVNPATSPTALASLDHSSVYNVYVRQNCGVDGFSANSTVHIFNTLAPPPSNDNCSGATPISDGTMISQSVTLATNDLTAPSCGGISLATQGVWFVYSVPTNYTGSITIEGCNSSYDMRVRVYEGSCGSFTCVVGDDDDDCVSPGSGLAETTTFDVDTQGAFHGGNSGSRAPKDYYILITGAGGTLDFTVTANLVLPITISKISAHNMGKRNMVSWTTSSEVNNDVQMVERSKDGISGWEMVGKVNGTNSREAVTYEVYDNKPFNTSFYRVHSVDFDGKEQFSKIVSVQREGRIGIITSIQPNPTANFVEIDLQPEFDGDITYTILDVTGKLLKTAVFSANNDALNTHMLDMSDLQSGLYFVTIQGGGINQNAKILKQ